MAVLLSNFEDPVPPCTSGDANCDGVIDGADLSSLLGQFGRACAYVEINYDYRNRMVKWQGFAESGHTAPADVHEYVYDCFSRRIAKKTDIGSAREREYRYAFGGRSSDALWRLLQMEVTDGEADPVTYTFVHTSGSVGYIDDVVSMRRESGAGEFLEQDDFWYHQDDLFTVVALTDEAGDVVERYEYQDYGQEHITLPNGSTTVAPNSHSGRIESLVGNPFTFTGRELDNETGLILYRTRYLQVGIGRFTTRDTIGVWGDEENSGNSNVLAASTPLARVDPFGLTGCRPDLFEPVRKIRHRSLFGHEYLRIKKGDRYYRRGFYPNNFDEDGKSSGVKDLINTPGSWRDENWTQWRDDINEVVIDPDGNPVPRRQYNADDHYE